MAASMTKVIAEAAANASVNCPMNSGGIGASPARMSVIVRGRGSLRCGSEPVVAASRCDSVLVSVRQMLGHFAVSRSKSLRLRRRTTLSRIAVTVAVRVPPVRNAISPIGCSGPISAMGSRRPSLVTAKRPVRTMKRSSAGSPWRTSTSPRLSARVSVSFAKASSSELSRSAKIPTGGTRGFGDGECMAARVPLREVSHLRASPAYQGSPNDVFRAAG